MISYAVLLNAFALSVLVLTAAACCRPHDEPDSSSLVDVLERDANSSPDVVDVDVSERVHCDPCERVAVCCAPAWGPGCAAVLLDQDGTLTRCRASFAAAPCATSCADPVTVPCETIRAGAVRWCE